MFLSTCEIMSTIIGALAGSIASSRVKMDLFGVIVCGTLAALGGGTVRDILLDIPVYWTLPSGEIFVLASVVTSLATFYVAQKYPPPMGTIRVADAIVLALWSCPRHTAPWGTFPGTASIRSQWTSSPRESTY